MFLALIFIDYLKSFIYGVLFGIPFCLAVGPVFFFLIQAGVNKGIKFALAIAYGVILADMVLINATYFFVEIIHDFIRQNYAIIQIFISVLLFAMGIVSIVKSNYERERVMKISKNGIFLFFMNGFIMDVLNPSNIFVWIGVNSKIIMYNTLQHLLFYLSSLITIAVLMISLAFLCKKIQPHLNNYVLKRINISLGIIYIGISIALLLGSKYFHNLFI